MLNQLELADRAEITDVLIRLARSIDRGDRSGIASCYAGDSFDDHGPFRGTGEDFADFSVANLRGARSTFHGVMSHLIEVDGSTAWAETYYQMYRVREDGGCMLSFGRYLDDLERTDGRWLVVRRIVVPQWSGDLAAENVMDLAGMGFAVSTFDETDPSNNRKTSGATISLPAGPGSRETHR